MSLEDLPYKRRMFVEYYLNEAHFNATDAARMAGYTYPKVQGPRLLTMPPIRAAIDQKIDSLTITPEEVVQRLTDQARADMGDFITVERNGNFRLNLHKAKIAGKLHLIKRLRNSKDGPSIELYDAQVALKLIGTHFGMFNHDLSGLPQKLLESCSN
jgi:hypothetical protein